MDRRFFLAICLGACGAAPAWPQTGLVALGPVDSAARRFRASLDSDASIITINHLTVWRAHIETPAGAPVANARISVSFGVPGIGRRGPTAPRVVPAASPGDYAIRGVRFDMAGRWRLDLHIEADGVTDSVAFDIDAI